MSYVSNMTLLSLCPTNCSIVTLESSILNMFRDIKLLSLSVSTSCSIFALFSATSFYFFIILNVILLKLKDIIVTMSMCLFISSYQFANFRHCSCCISYTGLPFVLLVCLVLGCYYIHF